MWRPSVWRRAGSGDPRPTIRQSEIVPPGTEYTFISPLGAPCVFTTLLWRVRGRLQTEFRHEVQVLLDQGQRMACGLSDVLLGHSTIATQLDSPEAVNIVFNCLWTVIGLLGDLAGRFVFHQAFVTLPTECWLTRCRRGARTALPESGCLRTLTALLLYAYPGSGRKWFRQIESRRHQEANDVGFPQSQMNNGQWKRDKVSHEPGNPDPRAVRTTSVSRA